MPKWEAFALDLMAIGVLVLGVYFPRYRRRDLVVAYVGLNVGVFAVSLTLSRAAIGGGVGFGLGLFAVLSIIRLRSAELAQQEIAYYFAALALALVNGVELDPRWWSIVLSVMIVGAMFLADHPRLFGRHRYLAITLDRAITDERELIGHLEELLGARVRHLQVRRVDLVEDTTVADVRYQLPPERISRDRHPG
jgi:hypothetical protein